MTPLTVVPSCSVTKMTGVCIVGVDGSATARRAPETARELALALSGTLHVVTAFEDDRPEVVGSGSHTVGLAATTTNDVLFGVISEYVSASKVRVAITPYA